MSTAAIAPVPDGAARDVRPRSFPAPPMGRLVGVELRKMVDTRAGRWLLIASVFLALVVAVVSAVTGDAADRDLEHAFQITLLPLGVLLPVIGILTATGEWSQRTALTTFALVPRRERIGIAKVLASLLLGVLTILVSLLMGVVGNVVAMTVGGADGSWSLGASSFLQALLFEELGLLMGLGFGLLFISSPVAIVAYFALPTAFSFVGSLITSLESTWKWIDPSQAQDPLTDGTAHGGDWARVAVSALIWIAIPVVVGLFRMARREVK